ncbi:fatty acyl-AMP ligase [Streptomyces sp. Da 82-17]|uniref:fatty acyl-AMP ligase n=1 Tax=Streptomyces sp. Da 82-17 TaxID=3377116 RepID=UPI0038D3D843
MGEPVVMYRTFTELMTDRAQGRAGHPALLLPPENTGAGPDVTVSYRELHDAACELAGWLQERGVHGERVLVMHRSPRQFTVSFLACLYAGAVAVPVPPVEGHGHQEERVGGILRDAAPCAALTDARLAPDLSRLLAARGRGSMPCLAADTVHGRSSWTPPRQDPDAPAYLQYTSGSTGSPRGVVVSHANLLANQQVIRDALHTGPDDRIGGWLPLHHDMGLVGQLLHPLWLGGTSVPLAPEWFARRPARWLEAVSEHGITVTAAPDFAYDLCVQRVTDEESAGLDLSGLRVAVSGGEPVRAGTARAFAERFAPAGLDAEALTSGYGLAEATLLVTAAPTGRGRAECTVDPEWLSCNRLRDPLPGGPARTLVSSGPAPDTVRIVDPETRQALPDGSIGEIWVRGPSVAAGYWRDRAETARTFAACTADGEPGFLRTGDLGALRDGRLYVTGRLKDVIVVAGRNLYPQDLEHTVQRVSSLLGVGTAFSVPGERERIVVVQELRTHHHYDLDLAGLTGNVERRLADEFQVAVGGVLLVRPGTVRRTTSGKVERATMRRLFLSGAIEPVHQLLDAELLDPGPLGREECTTAG